MATLIIVLAVLCLAFANGANDNFKGVATLYGSGTTSFRVALTWATITTLLGSLTAVVLAQQLLQAFSGKGLVADGLTADPRYLAAVGLGAGLTVLVATRLGMPISTTHGLVGALVGAGLAAGSHISLTKLQSSFLLPLLLSPLISLLATAVVYPVLSFARRGMGVTRETCFCVGTEVIELAPIMSQSAASSRVEQLTVTQGTVVSCRARYAGRMLGFESSVVLDWLHYLSAGIVSFARGLNDTPKIAAILLLVPFLGSITGTALVGLVIAAGGLVASARVAETMSRKITEMNPGQGLTANLLTGLIVIGASRLGMPVSTTHVSCGSLFGIGVATGRGQWNMILKILSAWVTTLPAGAAFGALSFWLIRVLVPAV